MLKMNVIFFVFGSKIFAQICHLIIESVNMRTGPSLNSNPPCQVWIVLALKLAIFNSIKALIFKRRLVHAL